LTNEIKKTEKSAIYCFTSNCKTVL